MPLKTSPAKLAYAAEYRSRPEVKAKRAAYYKLPRVRATEQVKSRKYQAEHRKDPRWKLLKHAKERAGQQGVPFDLELEDIVVPAVCPVLGIQLFNGVGASHDGSPSLDKVIPELGYVRGNVMVVSYKANAMKRNASLEDLERFSGFWLKFVAHQLAKEAA